MSVWGVTEYVLFGLGGAVVGGVSVCAAYELGRWRQWWR